MKKEKLFLTAAMDNYMLEAEPYRMGFVYWDEKAKKWKRFQKIASIAPEQLEKFEMQYSNVPDYVLTAITGGKIFVCPYSADAEAILQEKGFTEAVQSFSVITGDKPYKPFMRQWDSLLYRREYFERQKVKEAIKAHCELYGIEEIDPELLKHCFRIPDFGFRVYKEGGKVAIGVGHRSEHAMLVEEPRGDCYRVYPMSSYWRGPRDPKDILKNFETNAGHYFFKGGICMFVYSDGNTYLTPDYEVVMALEDALFELDFIEYMPNPADALSRDIEHLWGSLRMLYAPEKTFDCENGSYGYDGLYPYTQSGVSMHMIGIEPTELL